MVSQSIHQNNGIKSSIQHAWLQSVTQVDTMVKSMMTGTVTSSGHGGTAAAMAQNKQTAE